MKLLFVFLGMFFSLGSVIEEIGRKDVAKATLSIGWAAACYAAAILFGAKE